VPSSGIDGIHIRGCGNEDGIDGIHIRGCGNEDGIAGFEGVVLMNWECMVALVVIRIRIRIRTFISGQKNKNA